VCQTNTHLNTPLLCRDDILISLLQLCEFRITDQVTTMASPTRPAPLHSSINCQQQTTCHHHSPQASEQLSSLGFSTTAHKPTPSSLLSNPSYHPQVQQSSHTTTVLKRLSGNRRVFAVRRQSPLHSAKPRTESHLSPVRTKCNTKQSRQPPIRPFDPKIPATSSRQVRDLWVAVTSYTRDTEDSREKRRLGGEEESSCSIPAKEIPDNAKPADETPKQQY